MMNLKRRNYIKIIYNDAFDYWLPAPFDIQWTLQFGVIPIIGKMGLDLVRRFNKANRFLILYEFIWQG